MLTERTAKVRHLIAASRFREALAAVHGMLAEDPQSAELHAIASLCHLNEKNSREAANEAERAISAAPDWSWSYDLLSLALIDRKPKRAEQAIRKAIELDPAVARYRGSLSLVLLKAGRWEAAIRAADEGLTLDPNCNACHSNRTLALSMLGKHQDAKASAVGELGIDPDSSSAHARSGLVSLNQGNTEEAVQHFQEALRIDPSDDSAKAGLLETLRTRNRFYRITFLFRSWLRRQPTWTSLLIVFLIAASYQSSLWVLAHHRSYWPLLIPLILVTGALGSLRLVGDEFTDMFLQFHPIGRVALGPERRAEATTNAIFCSLAVVLLFATAMWKRELAVAGIAAAACPLVMLGVAKVIKMGKLQDRAYAYAFALCALAVAGCVWGAVVYR